MASEHGQRTDDRKVVALALQGGGSHTAFSWGVLDELLDLVADGRLEIAAISGASGGALTGAVCAYGLSQSPTEAKRLLAKFWDLVAQQSLWPTPPWRNLLPEDLPKEVERRQRAPYHRPWHRGAGHFAVLQSGFVTTRPRRSVEAGDSGLRCDRRSGQRRSEVLRQCDGNR